MYIYLSKILPLMVLPVGIAIELCVLSLLFLRKDKSRMSRMLLLTAVLVLWGSATPMLARTLYGSLERMHPPVAILDIPASKCIVLMGGAVAPVMPPGTDIDMYDSVDRVRKAAQLQRMGKGEMIIVSAGNQPWSQYALPEAESIKVLLMEWGVPADAIVLDRKSRNTRENAVNSASLIQKWRCGTPLLVTSAVHMPRAVKAFSRVRVNVFPVSTDVRVIELPQMTVFDYLPNAGALKMTTDAMREWLSQWVYEFRGWN